MPESGDNSQRRWATVGKVLASLAALATVGGFGFLLYDRLAAGADLTARVSIHDFRKPPRIEPESKPEESEYSYRRYSDLIPDYDKYLVVTIDNSGGTQADEVKLVSDYSGVTRISTDT